LLRNDENSSSFIERMVGAGVTLALTGFTSRRAAHL